MALEIVLLDGVLDKCFSCYVMESFDGVRFSQRADKPKFRHNDVPFAVKDLVLKGRKVTMPVESCGLLA